MLKLVLSTILICANCQIAIAVKIENHLAPVNHGKWSFRFLCIGYFQFTANSGN